MDNSETYIKMCEKATEIQALQPVLTDDDDDYDPNQGKCDDRMGSVFYILRSKEFILFHWDNDCNFLIIGDYNLAADEPIIWLPRQDQLQEMIGDYNSILDYWKQITWHWWHDEDGEFPDSNLDIKKYLSKFASMEQLWLGFVMKTKYGKLWDGDNWMKE